MTDSQVHTAGEQGLILEGLRKKLAEAEAQAEESLRRAEALRIACAEVEDLVKDAAIHRDVVPAASAPSSSEAVRIVMTEDPRIWRSSELLAELNRRGWPPTGANPDATLRSAIQRLCKAGTVETVDRGRYRVAADHPRGDASQSSLLPINEPIP